MQMSNMQLLGGTCLSPEVCGHPRLSVLECLDLYICLPQGLNPLGRAGMWGVPGWAHTRGAVWGVCHPVLCTCLPACEVCTHSLPLTTGIVNPVYSQQQDGQGAA